MEAKPDDIPPWVEGIYHQLGPQRFSDDYPSVSDRHKRGYAAHDSAVFSHPHDDVVHSLAYPRFGYLFLRQFNCS